MHTKTLGLLLVLAPFLPTVSGQDAASTWQQQAVEYARIMSHVKWTPVAETMPKRGGFFTVGTEYTGTPYSSTRTDGRYIGYDIFLKTFLAAVENPESVLYTENLRGKVSNAECYYGKVCSTYTSYALQCGMQIPSWLNGPKDREGVIEVKPATAQFAEVGDIIFRPPTAKAPTSHIELVTGITRGDDGEVIRVRVEESRPETTRETDYKIEGFDEHLSARGRVLFRITDLDAWRGANRSEAFLFPNYAEDSATPKINRVLLLNRGDWVPYFIGQDVKFNIMDRDNQGVEALLIQRGDEVIERILITQKGVLTRSFTKSGDYSAFCLMSDGAKSSACEFSVCDLGFGDAEDEVVAGAPLEIPFYSDNMKVIILRLISKGSRKIRHNVFVSEAERERGSVMIPAELTEDPGKLQVWMIGENRYGRLKKQRVFQIGGAQ